MYTILSPLRSMDACVILLATFGGTTSLRCQELTQHNRTRQSLASCNLWASIVFVVGVPERVLTSTSLAGSLWASNIVHFLSDLWFVYSLRRLNYREAVVQFVSSAAMLTSLLLSSMFQLSRIAGKIKQQARQFGNGSTSCSRHCPRVQFRFFCWTLTARLDCDIMLWVTSCDWMLQCRFGDIQWQFVSHLLIGSSYVCCQYFLRCWPDVVWVDV